ncbi:MAG: hypothetical protein KAT17_02240 [Candidatus Aminicenantes bacterium]|nr:hypothetical protein [Candidatus Aminicenantes bacterium]
MSPGYGKKIYKKRKNRLIPLLLGLVFIAIVIFLLVFTVKTNIPESKLIKPDNSKQSSHRFSDFQGKKMKPEANQPVTSEEKKAEPVISPGESLSVKPVSEVEREQTKFRDLDNLDFLTRHYFNQKQYKKALVGFQALMKTDNRYAVHAGQCYYFLEEYKNAYACLQDVLLVNPNDFEAKKFLALTCYKLDRFADSLRFTEEALDIKKEQELQAFHYRLIREVNAMKGYADRKTPGFKIIFSQYEHSEIRFTVMEILKDAYRDIGKKMNHYPLHPVTVILYNEKGFFDITRAPSWAGGLYDGKIRIPIKGAKGREKLLRRILFHEYTHALIHDLTPQCPLWINEGLAEFFSADHLKVIGQVIPLKYLEKRFPAGDPRLVAIAYLESYSAVSFLVSKFGIYRIKELLDALGRGEDINNAFEAVFHDPYENFLKNWGRE